MPNANLQSDVLTTLARAKDFLGIGSDRFDTPIVMILNQVNSFIKRYCKRDFKEATYTNEEYDGPGCEILTLKQFPVTALSSLQYNNATDNRDDWSTFDTADYFWYSDGRIKKVSGNFNDRPQAYRATYTAGYKIDFSQEQTAAAHTLPAELEYATHKLLSAVFNTRKAEGLMESRIGDSSVVLQKAIFTDPELKGILDKYAAFAV